MNCLTQQDFRHILEFVQQLNAPCSLETFPSHVLSILARVVSSENSAYCTLNFQSRTASIHSCASIAEPNPNSPENEQIERVAHQYFYEHPWIARYWQTSNGRAYKISDFLSESELHRLEGLYQQVMRPMGMEDMMIITLPNSLTSPSQSRLHWREESTMNILLNRSQRNFSERDRLVLNLLRPHIAQAYQNVQALTQIQHHLAQLTQTVEQLGAIAISGDGQVRLITQRAWELLRQYFQFSSSVGNHLPENLQRWVKYQISRLTDKGEISFPCLPLQLEREGKHLVIRFVIPGPDQQYLLLLEEQQPISLCAASLELLGLTKREAEVLFWVTQDKSDIEMASMLGISTRTVKKHLEHIYQKFAVHSRTAAVMYALKSLGMLISPSC